MSQFGKSLNIPRCFHPSNMFAAIVLVLPLAYNWSLKYDVQIVTDIDLLARLVVQLAAIVIVMLEGVGSWFYLAVIWSLVLSIGFGLSQEVNQKLVNEIVISTINFFGPIAITLFLIRKKISSGVLHGFFRMMIVCFILCAICISYVLLFDPEQLTFLRFSEGVSDILIIRGGRLSLTFSEPSHAGFILGFVVLYLSASRAWLTSRFDLFLLVASIAMLLATGAKFAIPVTLLSILILYAERIAKVILAGLVYGAVFIGLFGYFLLDEIYLLISALPYEMQETFVTRLSFFFSTSEFVSINPIGYGFSKLFQTQVVDVICDRVAMAMSHRLKTGEMQQYCTEPGLFFGAKEHFSLMALHFGFFGVVIFLMIFEYVKNKSNDPRYLAYWAYFMLSIMSYERFTGVNPGVYLLLMMGAIIREKKN